MKYDSDTHWKILVIDDNVDVIELTRMTLAKFSLFGKKLNILSANSRIEAEEIMQKNPDVAMIFLDVVMEERDSGLRFVNFVRKELENRFVRIILRTGEVFDAFPTQIVREYDINDYVHKADLTVERLNITVINALRSYNEVTANHRNVVMCKRVLQGMRNTLGLEDSDEVPETTGAHDLGASKITEYIRELEDILGFSRRN